MKIKIQPVCLYPIHRILSTFVVTHSAASFYFVRETLEALKVKVERRLFRGLHFLIFGFPSTESGNPAGFPLGTRLLVDDVEIAEVDRGQILP